MQITPPPMPDPFGYLCEWKQPMGYPPHQIVYYGEPGNAIDDDWNIHPEIHKNLPILSAQEVEARDQQWLAIVKEAVLAEREACAKVCEMNAQRWPDARKAYAAHECAAAIRSRSTT